MGEQAWLGVDAFSALVGISPQAARKALRRASQGLKWQGQLLEVRQVSGRGGRRGLSYQVALRSLPEAFKGPLSSPSEIPFLPRLGGLEPDQLIDLAETCARPEDRVRVIEAWCDLTGKSRETAYRKVRAMAEGGHVALLRKTPANAGAPRVPISRAFLAAWSKAGQSLEDAWTLHRKLEDHIAAMWTTAHANAGSVWIGKRASEKLKTWCAELGFIPTGISARKIFAVSPRMAKKSRTNNKLHRKNTDAAGHYNAAPFRRSNLNLLKPMEILMTGWML